jgi:hypothetical protein
LTVEKALLLPARTVSPLARVTATPSGWSSARPRRSASASSSRLRVGAEPNSSCPGHEDHQVGAEAVDLVLDLLLGPAADGHQHHHRGDADDDAEHGEQAAQPVRAQGRDGDAERLGDPHPSRPSWQHTGHAGGAGRIGLEQSVAHADLPAGAGGDVEVVGHQHDGDALLAVEPLEQRHHLLAGAGVEVAGGLVGEQHLRLAHQGAGDGDPLLLTAGQLVRPVVEAVAHAHPLQGRLRAPPSLPPARTPVHQGHPDVVEGAGAGQQLEGLEDEADGAVAQLGQLVLAHRGDVAAAHPQHAGRRPVEPAEQVHQRRLAGAGRPDDGGVVAALDGEGDAAEGVDRDALELVGAGDVDSLESRCGHVTLELTGRRLGRR